MATSGAQALQQIAEHRPDVVLMDIHIDGPTDGIETAAQIPADLQIPVIYLTAYSEEATLERARGTQSVRLPAQAVFGARTPRHHPDGARAAPRRCARRARASIAWKNSLASARPNCSEQTALRLQAERDLHQTQKMEAIGQLTGGVAHDFNNLLTVIMGSLDRIQRRPDLPVEELRRSAGDGAASQSEGGDADAPPAGLLAAAAARSETADVNHLLGSDVGHAAADAWRDGRDRNGARRVAYGHVSIDANQLESALLNLAVNARDAMPASGKLTIETRQRLPRRDCTAARTKDVTPGDYVVVA